MNGNDILSLMKMMTERSHLSTPCVVFVNVHFRVDAWQFSILNTFRPQLSLKPLIDSEILIPLMDDLTLDYTKYKLYNNLNLDFRIS